MTSVQTEANPLEWTAVTQPVTQQVNHVPSSVGAEELADLVGIDPRTPGRYFVGSHSDYNGDRLGVYLEFTGPLTQDDADAIREQDRAVLT